MYFRGLLLNDLAGAHELLTKMSTFDWIVHFYASNVHLHRLNLYDYFRYRYFAINDALYHSIMIKYSFWLEISRKYDFGGAFREEL